LHIGQEVGVAHHRIAGRDANNGINKEVSESTESVTSAPRAAARGDRPTPRHNPMLRAIILV